MQTVTRTLAFVLSALLVVACGDKDEPKSVSQLANSKAASSLLEHVPADTPYFAGTLAPLDAATMKAMEPMTREALSIYGKLIKSIMLKASEDSDSDEDGKAAAAFMNFFGDELADGNLDGLGLDLNTTYVLYGRGLLPVARVVLADPDKFESGITKLENETGKSAERGSVGGQDYRYFGDDDVRVLIALQGNQVVLTFAPADASENVLKDLLGLNSPAKSLADSDRLKQLGEKYGYLPQSIGFIDTVRIADTFLVEQSGPNAELLAKMDYDPSSLSADCQAEIRDMANVMPMLSFGYTSISAKRFDMRMVSEFRSDIAAGLKPLALAVPGVGGDTGGVLGFGFSMDIAATRRFMEARLDAIEAKPYKCEHFADLQEGTESARSSLNQPLPPFVENFRGASFVIDEVGEFDFAGGTPPDMQLRAMLSIDDAQSLLMMGQMFVPALAELQLEPNGKVVALPEGTVPGNNMPAFVATTKDKIALGVGDKSGGRLGGMLEAKAPATPVFTSFSYDMGEYMRLMGGAMEQARSSADADASESIEEVEELFEVLGKYMDRSWFDLVFTDNGAEIIYSVTLK